MRNPKFSHTIEVVWELPESLRALQKLAMNFRWAWHHETRDLFQSIDPARWEHSRHNPIGFLYGVGEKRLTELTQDDAFLSRLRVCEEDLDAYLAGDTWYARQSNRPEGERFAYFCAEFGVTEGLPIYSGGLGILAGDHLKAASDLGLPLVGVGLLYSRGYFRQKLNADGWQQEVYPQYDFYSMPLTLIKNESHDPLRVEVEFPDRTVTCQIWRAEVGRVTLYLLDSNVLENEPADQGITDTLYGGDEEMRIRQEMILGIGGFRALRAVGVHPTVCHMNEGHAAFLSLERIRKFMQDHRCDFKTARQAIVNGNVFTTHTPVPAGFDLFQADLLRRYMGKTVASTGLAFDEFVRLGRIDPENEGEAFNMAVLAMENANHVNGVSQLHAQVTRSMFQSRWPDYPENEIPIDGITNGIHTLTWVSVRSAELYDRYLGPRWREEPADPDAWAAVTGIPDEELWNVRQMQRSDMVAFARRTLVASSTAGSTLESDEQILDPNALTIGFARRFATYKRATLMLSDRERLIALLTNSHKPLQIVVAGKSHPRDDGGKHLIQAIVRFIRESGLQSRMVFLEDYDMGVARALVQGVDVWLNNPRRPMEASGTSGMKVVPNGGLNCSILDGWWDEGYSAEVGFALGDPEASGDEGHLDWLDGRSLYSVIEQEIVPRFYNRDGRGIPTEWMRMMRASISQLSPRFSTSRMVREYAERFYLPSSDAYLRMSGEGLSRSRAALDWRAKVRAAWPSVAVASSGDGAGKQIAAGQEFPIKAQVSLGSLSPEDVLVQALVGKMGSNRELTGYQTIDLTPTGQDGSLTNYEGQIRLSEPGHQGYTVRVIPNHPDVHVPSELNLVRWQ